jgi:hypothetical protein
MITECSLYRTLELRSLRPARFKAIFMHYIVHIKPHTNFHPDTFRHPVDAIIRKFSLTVISSQHTWNFISTKRLLNENPHNIHLVYESNLKLTDASVRVKISMRFDIQNTEHKSWL